MGPERRRATESDGETPPPQERERQRLGPWVRSDERARGRTPWTEEDVGEQQKEMTRGLGGPRVKARLAREGSRRGVLRAGRKKNVPGRGRFRPDPEKIVRATLQIALTAARW